MREDRLQETMDTLTFPWPLVKQPPPQQDMTHCREKSA
jgi:hypothetical protein